MKATTITAAIIAAISGVLLADSEKLLPPVLTAIFAFSACLTIAGALVWNRREGRNT